MYLSVHFSKSRKSFAMPAGNQVYGDLMAEGRILRSRNFGLSGKPDKVMKNGNNVIPYEYKSTDASKPREGHMLQMAAYFVILEENYPDSKVEYGVLKYKNCAFRIENDPRLRGELFKIMDRMRNNTGEPERNHESPGRCFRCSFGEICSQRLIR